MKQITSVPIIRPATAAGLPAICSILKSDVARMLHLINSEGFTFCG